MIRVNIDSVLKEESLKLVQAFSSVYQSFLHVRLSDLIDIAICAVT